MASAAADARAAAAVGGLQLRDDVGEAERWQELRRWGLQVDASLHLMSGAFSTLRDEVAGTQAVLVATVHDAKLTLGGLHEGFRSALEAQGLSQRNAVELVVTNARSKFTELEARLSETITQMEQWALGEGARTAQQIAGAASRLGGPSGSPLGTPAGTPPATPRRSPAGDPFAVSDPWLAGGAGGGSFGPVPRQRGGPAHFEAFPGQAAAAQQRPMPQPAVAAPPTGPWAAGSPPDAGHGAPWPRHAGLPRRPARLGGQHEGLGAGRLRRRVPGLAGARLDLPVSGPL